MTDKREPRVFKIPEEHISKAYELFDVMTQKDSYRDRHTFWCFIADIFPETKRGRWCLGGHILQPTITELLGEEEN